MNKFEQLIEFVINDDEAKARELFHEIVVEKSREIYENLMNEEAEEEVEESAEEDEEGEELEEGMSAPDADSADNLIDDVEAEEEGMYEEEEEIEGEEEVDLGGDEGEESEEGLEDRVVDLEDKLDELMAEFEALMGQEQAEHGDEFGGEEELDIDAGGDALEMDDTAEFTDEAMGGFMEGVDLKAAPAPVKSEEGGINTKSTVAANAGAKGPVGGTVKPVATATGEEKGRTAPTAKDLGGTTSPKQGPAPKPVTSQASGVNTKSPVAKG